MMFDGDAETLKITENTQPAILITSIAQPAFTEQGIKPDVAVVLALVNILPMYLQVHFQLKML